jgi:hypothetical protein
MLTGKKNGYLIAIHDDEILQNSREFYTFGKMVCFHRRHALGDKHDFADDDELLKTLYTNANGGGDAAERKYERLLDGFDIKEYGGYGSSRYTRAVDSALIDAIRKEYVILPLYLYDHSGLTMNTTGFTCPWDSGQVGWIYASKDEVLREFGGKLLTEDKRQRAKALLESEVKSYDTYLRGECYGYELYKNGVQEDSLWGFPGSLDEVRDAIEENLPKSCRGITENLTEYQYRPSLTEHLTELSRKITENAKPETHHSTRGAAVR